MKTTLLTFISLFFLLSTQFALGQSVTVTGTVTDDTGFPLPGANVIVKGTSNGTQTDFDGNYSIKANQGEILVFSYVGFDNSEVAITTASSYNVQMVAGNVLETVVVTAFGIKKEKKAIGYAVTTLDAEAIESKPEADIIRSLNGKVAGVQIVGSGGATGSSTKFTIRGQSSINGSNQPLFIVDGVPFDTGTNSQGDFTTGSSTTSSRFMDLDPNNIANVSILKGLNASVLYGQAGRNGVVIITTKNGSSKNVNKKFEVTVNSSTYIKQISNLPDYQNEYGQGADNLPNAGFVGNWGGRFDDDLMIAHPLSANFGSVFPEFDGLEIPYEAVPDNVKDFFRTGFGSNLSVNVSAPSTENTSYNLSFARTNEEGYIPNNELTRYNFGVGGRAKLANNFTFEGSANYSNVSIKTPPISANNGGGTSIFTRLLFTPRNLDLGNLPYQNPNDGSNVYYRNDQDNPYWLLNNAATYQDVDRFYGRYLVNYKFSDNLDLTYRFGLDTYSERQINQSNKGSSIAELTTGFKNTTLIKNTIFDHNLIFGLTNLNFGDKVGLTASVGAGARRDAYESSGLAATGQVVFDVFNDRNFSTIDDNGYNAIIEQNVIGLYAETSFDYDDFLYVNLSGRNDWGSTVEEENRSLFYPGVSLSFVPTSIGNFGGDTVNYLKLRGGYGSSARFPTPYNTRPILNSNATAFITNNGDSVITNSLPSDVANPNLRPELISEFEAGIEANLFKSRVSLDLTVYKRSTEDQIVDRPISPSTGFTGTTFNIAQTEQEGIEIGLNITPLKSEKFSWDINSNFSAYENKVTDLGGIESFAYAGFSDLGNFASEGEPLGVIKGSYAVRYSPDNITEDNPLGLGTEGQLLINPTNGKIFDSTDLGLDIETIGDPNPDFNLTAINTFKYENWSLSGQVEYQHGGDIYSQTITQYYRRGVTTANVDNREGSYVLDGILANPETGEPLVDANQNLVENEIQIGANDVYFINLVDPSGQGIYDASHMRLRELSLSYSMPENLLKNLPFGSVSFTVSGNNLYVKTFNIPDAFSFDPEQLSTGAGNGAGLDFQTGPTSKSYSFNVKATF